MKLCAALERRVAALEKVIGREGRTETAEAPKPTRRKRKLGRATKSEADEARSIIGRELASGAKSLKHLRRVTRCSRASLNSHLNRLRAAGTVERAAYGVWRLKLKVAA